MTIKIPSPDNLIELFRLLHRHKHPCTVHTKTGQLYPGAKVVGINEEMGCVSFHVPAQAPWRDAFVTVMGWMSVASIEVDADNYTSMRSGGPLVLKVAEYA